MENLYKRVGYFLREVTTPDGKPTMFFRYFIIDNDQNLHTTAHYSHIQNAIKSSRKFSELFSKVEKHFKHISFTNLKVGEVKEYTQPEILPFLNKKYFEVEVQVSDPREDVSDSRTSVSMERTMTRANSIRQIKGTEYQLKLFCFKDQHIKLLHDFLRGYIENSSKDKISCYDSYITLLKSGNYAAHLEKTRMLEKRALNEKLVSIKKNFEKAKQIEEKIREEEATQATLNQKTTAEDTQTETSEDVINDAIPEQEKIATEIVNNPETQVTETSELSRSEIMSEPKSPEKEEGKDIVDTKSGGKYSGNFKEGVAHGKGKEFFKSGISYVGQFKNGKRHGSGYFMDLDKSMNYVETLNGNIVGL